MAVRGLGEIAGSGPRSVGRIVELRARHHHGSVGSGAHQHAPVRQPSGRVPPSQGRNGHGPGKAPAVRARVVELRRLDVATGHEHPAVAERRRRVTDPTLGQHARRRPPRPAGGLIELRAPPDIGEGRRRAAEHEDAPIGQPGGRVPGARLSHGGGHAPDASRWVVDLGLPRPASARGHVAASHEHGAVGEQARGVPEAPLGHAVGCGPSVGSRIEQLRALLRIRHGSTDRQHPAVTEHSGRMILPPPGHVSRGDPARIEHCRVALELGRQADHDRAARSVERHRRPSPRRTRIDVEGATLDAEFGRQPPARRVLHPRRSHPQPGRASAIHELEHVRDQTQPGNLGARLEAVAHLAVRGRSMEHHVILETARCRAEHHVAAFGPSSAIPDDAVSVLGRNRGEHPLERHLDGKTAARILHAKGVARSWRKPDARRLDEPRSLGRQLERLRFGPWCRAVALAARRSHEPQQQPRQRQRRARPGRPAQSLDCVLGHACPHSDRRAHAFEPAARQAAPQRSARLLDPS
jgi:hypothetical protein